MHRGNRKWSELWREEIKVRPRKWLTGSVQPRAWRPFERGKIKEPEFTGISDREILLGFDPHFPDEPVTIPFNPDERISLILNGDNRAGKSILAKNLVFDQLHARFGRNILAIDPKGDTRTITKKNTKSFLIERLNWFGIKPKAYNAKYVSPEPLDVQGALAKASGGILYSLGMDNFLKLPKAVRYELLKTAWTKDEKAPAVERGLLDIWLSENPPAIAICNVYRNKIGKDFEKPDNCSAGKQLGLAECDVFKNKIGEDWASPKNCCSVLQLGLKENIKCVAHRGINPKCWAHLIEAMDKPAPNLMNVLLTYEKTKVIADNGIDYAKLLAENGILSIETGLSDPEKPTLADIFVEDAVINCLSDRIKSVTSANKEGNLHSPFTIFEEEMDVFAGKMKPTSNLLTQIITKYREISPDMKAKGIKTYGCDLIGLSQHISRLSSIMVREVDWILTPRLSDEKDGEVLRERGLDSYDVYQLAHLPFGRTHPKYWEAINKDGERFPFRPLPTASWM